MLKFLKSYWRSDILNKNRHYNVVNDLLKFVLCELKEKNMSISHFRIQKSIFKIKMELGQDHPLFDYLPFYWYEHGPFSNVVSKQFKELKNNNCIQYSSHTVFLDDKSFKEFSQGNSLIDQYPIGFLRIQIYFLINLMKTYIWIMRHFLSCIPLKMFCMKLQGMTIYSLH